MFSVGIFTTHLPYIAMVAFYAYFLIFGVNNAADGNIQITEKSVIVEQHINYSGQVTISDNICFYAAFEAISQQFFLKSFSANRTWNSVFLDKLKSGKFSANALVNRPPPALV